MNILLGLTGSVATTLAPKMVEALEAVPCASNVSVIMTEKACMFQSVGILERDSKVKVYLEVDEWSWSYDPSSGRSDQHSTWLKGDSVLHVELAKNSSVLVIAPVTANTIGKMAHGIVDNLLLSVYAAWRKDRPVVIAPAMNTEMWTSLAVQENVKTLQKRGVIIVPPINKTLACGDVGVGAMAHVTDIAKAVSDALKWQFPIRLNEVSGIPVGSHLGAFGAVRKHDRHCGVDLYCEDGTDVFAVEDGFVVSIEDFTGKAAGCGWWLDTKAVKVEGPSGVVCYGEISPNSYLVVGDRVYKRSLIGRVTPVLPPNKLRTDIEGHSCSMLHLQIYKHGTLHRADNIGPTDELPEEMIDPTPYLLEAANGIKQLKGK
jgi:phosphopantothenoylcysteine decarboxylase